MKTITLHFHDVAAKHAFILRNKIGASEIMSESPASLTLEDTGESWEASPYVQQVTKEKESFESRAKRAIESGDKHELKICLSNALASMEEYQRIIGS